MKKLLCLALNICMLASLASCGDAGFKPALDTSTKCNIRVIGDYKNFEALEDEFDKFNKYYPDVSLSYRYVEDYTNMVASKLSGNEKANIFFSYASWMSGNEQYAEAVSYMEDLSDANYNLNLNCIRPGLLNRTADKKVFMVPVFSRTYGTLVNNDLFKKENVKIPTTWDELLNACKSFKDKGYKSPMMGYSLKASNSIMYTIAYPLVVAELAKNPEALALANNLDPSAGQYTRNALEKVKALADNKYFDLDECDKIEDNYNEVIMRFFEGDVPMMVCLGDTVSGTGKREGQSEAFTKSPFKYTYIPIPATDKGGYFIDSPSVQFSVNKDCDNLDMTNEFMRFLISNKELNAMAASKRLVTPTNAISFDPVYAAFGKVPTERTFSPEMLGIKDPLTVQVRNAAYEVGKGGKVEDAVAKYGQY